MSRGAVDQEARSLVSDVQGEASSTAGPGYVVTVELGGVHRVAPDLSSGGLGLPAYESTYSVVIRSLDVPAFVQTTEAYRHFGPGSLELIGGLHDWALFRGLAEWDFARRTAFLRYIAQRRNPYVLYAQLLSSRPSGTWSSDDAAMVRRVRSIGARHGYSLRDLAWASIVESDSNSGELLGYNATRGRWELLATRESEDSGPLVEAK
jgi:hypothetical protein